MNYANIKYNDVANGTGVRTTLFVSGCRHHCKGCFNSEAWDFSFGKEFKTQTEIDIVLSLHHPWIRGLSILGGEPFEPENLPSLVGLTDHVRTAISGKTIWCYTGFTWEQLMELGTWRPDIIPFLNNIDVLVDGKFVEELKDLSLRFRGSSNQRIIDVQASLESGEIVLMDMEKI